LDGTTLKLKSPYYLTTKFFARKTQDKLQKLLDNPVQARQYVDEEYYPLIEHLSSIKDEFVGMNEQQRIKYVRDWIENAI